MHLFADVADDTIATNITETSDNFQLPLFYSRYWLDYVSIQTVQLLNLLYGMTSILQPLLNNGILRWFFNTLPKSVSEEYANGRSWSIWLLLNLLLLSETADWSTCYWLVGSINVPQLVKRTNAPLDLLRSPPPDLLIMSDADVSTSALGVDSFYNHV